MVVSSLLRHIYLIGPSHRVPAADAKFSQVGSLMQFFSGRIPTNCCQEAMNETFLLSNIAPQVGDGFNRHCERLPSYVIRS